MCAWLLLNARTSGEILTITRTQSGLCYYLPRSSHVMNCFPLPKDTSRRPNLQFSCAVLQASSLGSPPICQRSTQQSNWEDALLVMGSPPGGRHADHRAPRHHQ